MPNIAGADLGHRGSYAEEVRARTFPGIEQTYQPK
jgi:hypothetical protein